MNGPSSRIVDLDEAERRVRAVRRRGGKVVLANGVFDLLHVGHLRYLADAAAAGNLLVVGINSDRSVRRLKGAGRPFLPEAERAELVAGLRAVDVVVIFEDADVGVLLRRLRPDFHAKGTDYTEETVPERDLVAECGGRVLICGDPKDHATSDLVARIRRSTGPE